MNCREAQQQIFAERDSALDNHQRAALVEHVAHCADCKRIRNDLTTVLASWRMEAQKVTVPDPELEWYAVRRQIRGGVRSGDADRFSRRKLISWLAVPLAGAAALAVALLVPSETSLPASTQSAVAQVVRADSVEVPGNNASTMVFVDDKSGWLIVWASDEAKRG